MPADSRVRQIVLARAPPRHKLRTAVGTCLNVGRHKSRHTYTISLGGATRHSVGMVLEICTSAADHKCQRHLRTLRLQMPDDQRVMALIEIASLTPPPYQDEAFVDWCYQSAVDMGSRSQIARASVPEGRSADDVSNSGMELGMSRRDVAQQVNVRIYVYHTNSVGPHPIDCVGVRRGVWVRYVLRQDVVLQVLGIHAKDRASLARYEVYEPRLRSWTKSVAPSQPLTLLPGQGLIYRDGHVTRTPRLEEYVSKTAAPTSRPQPERPAPAHLASTSLHHDRPQTRQLKRSSKPRPIKADPGEVLELTDSEDDKPSKKGRHVKTEQETKTIGQGIRTDPWIIVE
ncbi:hypothetical protein C8Q76DRAFT_794876 [Earliella scabrosa]|nr:hypothetical protein C8Q76DRAFT_794876 [Earliella scabrosa]